jgi:hypothetical protein
VADHAPPPGRCSGAGCAGPAARRRREGTRWREGTRPERQRLARGKVSHPESQAEKFRPRRAAPKPGQHCPRVDAARRYSPTGKLRRGARGVAAQGHREEPQPVREADSLDPRAERENPERAAGRDHPGTKSCSPRRVAATLSPTCPQGLAKPDPDLTHRLSSGARASLQKKASTIHDIWDPNVAHPKSHSSNTFLCCETRCPGDSTLLPHQPGEVMRPWVLGQ